MTVALALGVALGSACSEGGSDAGPDAGDAQTPDAAAPVFSACPPGEFAQGFALDGTLRCSTIDEAATAALTGHCSLFLGWNDNCTGCTTTPAKWGRVSGLECENGVGLDNTCADTSLGGVSLPMFGLSLDGNVNDDDKFHLGLECTPPADEPAAGPCAPGSFMTSIVDGEIECATGAAAMVGSFAETCDVYFGWRDNCDGCTSAPSKWGRASSEDCEVGAGVSNTCTSFNLGGTAVFALGINSEGDFNDDDKLYLGFQCNGALESSGLTTESCPPGELIIAIEPDGIRCASPAVAAESAVKDGCYLYFGWRDNCDGCSLPPTKWGRVGDTLCENGEGLDNTCASTPLDGNSVQLLGINTDGDVNDDDKLYLGLSCPSI